MWGVATLILVIFLTIWMSLTFTGMLCDNEYVGMGLCYDPAWKAKRPVSFCPPCAPATPAPPVNTPSPAMRSTYTAEPFAPY